jgi:hypothetical protein
VQVKPAHDPAGALGGKWRLANWQLSSRIRARGRYLGNLAHIVNSVLVASAKPHRQRQRGDCWLTWHIVDQETWLQTAA